MPRRAAGQRKTGCRPSQITDKVAGSEPVPGPAEPTAGLPLSLAPGGIVHVRLRLEHQHVLYRRLRSAAGRPRGRAHAGAGRRSATSCRWTASNTWRSRGSPGPSRPKSAATPGIPSRVPTACTSRPTSPAITITDIPDRPVRYGTHDAAAVLVPDRRRAPRANAASGSPSTRTRRPPGGCSNDAGFEKCLKTVGRWTKVEHVFTTDAEATTLALDFRIAGDTDIGEMWIDDVSLEPVGCPGHVGP